jgi:hypothetical protein
LHETADALEEIVVEPSQCGESNPEEEDNSKQSSMAVQSEPGSSNPNISSSQSGPANTGDPGDPAVIRGQATVVTATHDHQQASQELAMNDGLEDADADADAANIWDMMDAPIYEGGTDGNIGVLIAQSASSPTCPRSNASGIRRLSRKKVSEGLNLVAQFRDILRSY